MKKQRILTVAGITACLALSAFYYLKPFSTSSGELTDEALLSIIKNDRSAFESFLAAGGNLDTVLKVDGSSYTVGELIVKHNRLGFIEYAQSKKLEFSIDHKKDFDIHSLAVSQDNPEMLSLLFNGPSKFKAKTYGAKEWSLLHLASSQCSHRVISVLHKAGMNWDLTSKDGRTPLTIAAEEGCLQALSYWKNQGANFKSKDGRGKTAIGILSKKKDAALLAFADSFMDKRSPGSTSAAPVVPNFYKKRKIPKDNLADRAHLIEPELRPEDAHDTAEYSEFSD